MPLPFCDIVIVFIQKGGDNVEKANPLKASPWKLPLSVLAVFHWLEFIHCKEDEEVGPGKRENSLLNS